MKAPTTPQFLVSLVVVALLGAVVGAAAAGTPSPAGDRATGSPAANVPAGSSAAPSGAAAATATPAPVVYAGTVAVAPEHGPIGSLVDVTGSGFPADTGLELGWQAFSASWKLEPSDPANYKGREYQEELVRLGTMTTDGQGVFRTTFMVPDGFGFAHDVRVLQGGALRNQTTFKVDMEVAVSPKSGPPGTPITIDVKGIGVSSLTRSWLVTYDDHYTGWLSSVTTNGRARTAIPATGGPGAHVLKIVHGSFTFPYLNPNQSPDPTRPTFTEIFTVTAGPPVLPPPAAEQAIVSAATAPRPDATGPKAWVDRVEATVGQRVILNGADMPAGATFAVAWQTQVGVDTQIIGGGGQARPESESAVGTVTTDAVGAFSLPFEVPVDKGGNHSILVRSGDQVVAAASLRVRPRALPLSAQRGPVGTVITVSLQGVDDTDTGKIFMLVYDNAMLGYSCSVTGQGQITIELPATGVPGWHFIDLYPGIYKGEDLKDVYNYRIPQLTYADDHPGETLPAFRFAFEVTP